MLPVAQWTMILSTQTFQILYLQNLPLSRSFQRFFLSQCSPVLFSQYINLFYIEIDFYFVLRNFDCSCGKFDAVCRNTALPTHSYNINNISQIALT